MEHGTAIIDLIHRKTGRSSRSTCSMSTGQDPFSRPSCTRAGMTTGASPFSEPPTLTSPTTAAGSHDTLEAIWEQFVDEVKSDPARPLKFRDANFDEFLIREDLLGRRTVRVPAGTVLYRSRLGFVQGPNGDTPYSGAAIGAPPPEKAGAGRANTNGKVVLYCSDEEGTAIAEARPARGEYVSVAEIRAAREIEVLDLATEPKWPNPFTDESVS